MNKQKATKSVGQPSKYKPEYCEELIKHMEGGLSFEAFGGVVSVSRQTLYEWRDKHPEFNEAFKLGLSLCLKYYEEIGKQAMHGLIENFNTAIYCFNMKNRFGWADKVEAKVENTGGISINYSLFNDK